MMGRIAPTNPAAMITITIINTSTSIDLTSIYKRYVQV